MEEVESTKRQRGEDDELPSEQPLDSKNTAASHQPTPCRGISKRQKHNRRERAEGMELEANPIASILNTDQSEQHDLVVTVISSSDEDDNTTVQTPTAAEVDVVDDIGPDSFVITQFGDGVVTSYRRQIAKHRNLNEVKPMYEVQLSWGRVFTMRAELNHMPMNVYTVYGMPGKSEMLQITRADMVRLHPGRFLNDTLIEFYTRCVLSDEPRPRVKVFSPLFFVFMKDLIAHVPDTKLSFEARWKRINNWLGDIDIFNYNMLIFPVNEHLHWSLAVVCNPHRILEYQDIMRIFTQQHMKAKKQWPRRDKSNVKKKNTRMMTRRKRPYATNEVTGGHGCVVVAKADALPSPSDPSSAVPTEDSTTINIASRRPSGSSTTTTREALSNLFGKKKDLPCILLLDSAKVHRAQSIFAGVRKFLSVAWDRKKTQRLGPCEISSQTLPGFSPPTPIQANDCDCGSIFSRYWFTREAVCEKRIILRNMLDLLAYNKMNGSEPS